MKSFHFRPRGTFVEVNIPALYALKLKKEKSVHFDNAE
jgi:hypothetical protein